MCIRARRAARRAVIGTVHLFFDLFYLIAAFDGTGRPRSSTARPNG